VQEMKVPVVSNVEATPNADRTRVVPLLLQQVTAPVRWVECLSAMASAGVTRLVELGPGRVLSGLARSTLKGMEVLNVEDVASLQKALAAVQGKG
jgi:[acyl-carrier-protein] S-malonyltransferase